MVSRRRRRGSITGVLVAAAAAVIAAVIGYNHTAGTFTSPSTMTTKKSPTSGASVAPSTALTELHQLTVSDAYVPGYDRDAFGPAWADVDHNGCDTRNDVLRKDLSDVVTKPGTHGCVVLSGILHDPYTGKTISFHRGPTSSMAVQIDHRFPLSLAWRHGAASWTAARREAFANDQAANLVAVDGDANEQKSDSGPGEWMPPNVGDACDYAASFVAVATKWGLSIGSADQRTLNATLTSCN